MLNHGKIYKIIFTIECLLLITLLFMNLTYKSENYSLRSQVVKNDYTISHLTEECNSQKEEINKLTDKKRLEEIARRIGLKKVIVKNI